MAPSIRPRNGGDEGVSRDTLASRCLDAALALTESAARRDFRGPDPLTACGGDGRGVGGRASSRRQAVMQLHARSPVDVPRALSETPPADPEGAGIFGSVGARSYRLNRAGAPLELGLRAVDLLDSDLGTARPRAWGYHWDIQTRRSFYPARSPNVVMTAFGASGLLEAGALMGRSDFAARAREAARWARGTVGRAGWIFRVPPRASGEHPQREPARRLAGRCRRSHRGRQTRPASDRPDARRPTPRRVMAGARRWHVDRGGMIDGPVGHPRGSRPPRLADC